MELGFETIGNATLICHDDGPVLVTDPWIDGSAYFGSWTFSHEIPEEQREHIRRCKYVWLSHGHPDHLSSESLEKQDKTLLLPNHFGDRIKNDLTAQGYTVRVLTDRMWIPLSPRLRVMCIPDVNQDAVLLVDLDGRLLVNLNDAGDRGWGRFVRGIIRGYRETYLMALSGYGDADMINYFTEWGERIPPYAAARTPVGQTIARQAAFYGARYFVPFSSMHKYQRADSIWASQYTTSLEDYARGFESSTCALLPAFLKRDFLRDTAESLRPPERVIQPVDPKEFGDDWTQPLEPEDAQALETYFRRVQHLEEALDFLRFRVGGRNHIITFRKNRFRKGITFEAPRTSLMTAVRYEFFDDLLIGNFMKTTLHGDFGEGRLYPDFSPYVAKYADNGRAHGRNELATYFTEYRRRDPVGFLRSKLETHAIRPLQTQAAGLLRGCSKPNSAAFRMAKEAFWKARSALF